MCYGICCISFLVAESTGTLIYNTYEHSLQVYLPAFFVAVDHKEKAIVISIRGTRSLVVSCDKNVLTWFCINLQELIIVDIVTVYTSGTNKCLVQQH